MVAAAAVVLWALLPASTPTSWFVPNGDTQVAGLFVEREQPLVSRSADSYEGDRLHSLPGAAAEPSAAELSAAELSAAEQSAADQSAADQSAADQSAADQAPVAEVPPQAALQSGTLAVKSLEQVRAEVLAALTYPWQNLPGGWRIEFVGPRKGYRGSTFPDEHLIRIYVRPELSFQDLLHVTAHELGHAIDVSLLTPQDRSDWSVVRGRQPNSAWWAGSGETDFSSGAGDFAECFAWSQTTSGGWYSKLGDPPSSQEIELLHQMIG